MYNKKNQVNSALREVRTKLAYPTCYVIKQAHKVTRVQICHSGEYIVAGMDQMQP